MFAYLFWSRIYYRPQKLHMYKKLHILRFSIPYYFELGGGWPGYLNTTTVFPQFLYVDYVRVYQKP